MLSFSFSFLCGASTSLSSHTTSTQSVGFRNALWEFQQREFLIGRLQPAFGPTAESTSTLATNMGRDDNTADHERGSMIA